MLSELTSSEQAESEKHVLRNPKVLRSSGGRGVTDALRRSNQRGKRKTRRVQSSRRTKGSACFKEPRGFNSRGVT